MNSETERAYNDQGSPQIDSSFSFHPSEYSPLGSPDKLSPGLSSNIQSNLKFKFDVLPVRTEGLQSIQVTDPTMKVSNIYARSPNHLNVSKAREDQETPRKDHKSSRRNTILQERLTSPRPSKLNKIPAGVKIGEENSSATINKLDLTKASLFKPRERIKDLSRMTNDELIDLAIRILKKDPEKRTIRDLLALSKCVIPVGFFQDIDKETTLKCLRHMYYVSYKANQTVFEIDTVGTTFWVILKGSVGVWVYVNKCVGTNAEGEEIFEDVLTEVKGLPAGSSFGELALLENKKKRAASIICKEPCEFAVMDKNHFTEILKEKEAKKLDDEIDFLVSLPLFKSWSYNAVKLLYYNSVIKKYKRGHVLYEEGDVSTKMYIVRVGELKVLKQVNLKDERKGKDTVEKMKVVSPRKSIEMGIISERGVIGEEELLIDCKRKYKVVCYSLEVEVYEINKSVFLERIMKFPYSKEWLIQYVKMRENYYQSRLNSISQNNSTPISITQKDSGTKDVKDNKECVGTLADVPADFLRTVPERLLRVFSTRMVQTGTGIAKPDGYVNKNALNQLNKFMISHKSQLFEKQPDNDKLLNEQLDMRIYDTPTRVSQKSRRKNYKEKVISNNKDPSSTKSRQNSRSNSARERSIQNKKFETEETNVESKSIVREPTSFYMKANTFQTSLPTEESLRDLSGPRTNREDKQGNSLLQKSSCLRDSGVDYGLKVIQMSKSLVLGQSAIKEKFTKTLKSMSKDNFQSNGIYSPASSSLTGIVYNNTVKEDYDGFDSQIVLDRKEFKPFREHSLVKRMKEIEALKHIKSKLKSKKQLLIKGFKPISLTNLGDACLTLSERESNREKNSSNPKEIKETIAAAEIPGLIKLKTSHPPFVNNKPSQGYRPLSQRVKSAHS